MRTMIVTCDRCGIEKRDVKANDHDVWTDVQFRSPLTLQGGGKNDVIYTPELCSKCTEELMRFLNIPAPPVADGTCAYCRKTHADCECGKQVQNRG